MPPAGSPEPRLVLSTGNRGKQKELLALLAGYGWQVLTPDQVGGLPRVAETGASYAENAVLKALAAARRTGLWALADDTGLEVDALGGAPGLHSARFGPRGQQSTDAERRAHLLALLEPHPRPWRARFRCVVALAGPQGELWLAEGVLEGEIVPQARGEHGFGYDPLFFIPDLGRTLAELDTEAKNRLSHRAQAVRRLGPALRAQANLMQGGA